MEEHTDQPAARRPETKHHNYHLGLWLFVAMVALALVGMAMTMSMDSGGWEYWIALLAVYGGISVTRAWSRAKREGQPHWRMIRSQVLHWSAVGAVYMVLLMFERTDVISREAVSDVALVVLGLACFLAGVHFDWMFTLLGIVLTVMAVAIGYAEQYLVWIIMVPVVAAAGWFYVAKSRRHAAAA